MKTAVITGGSKGIGKALIIEFAKNGFQIITCARNKVALDELKTFIESTYSVTCHTMIADLSKKQEVLDFGTFVNKTSDSINALINNAGYFVPGDIHSEEDGTLESMIEANLYSAYHLTRSLIPSMIKQKSGHIFNICSIASITAYDNGGSYSISKYAMYGLTKNLREEMKSKGIKVTAILPGATMSASWEGVDVPEERLMKSSDVAETVFAAYQLSDRAVVEDLVIRPQLGDL